MPGQRPQRQMIDINVTETSGVDHPAHGREGWLVMKSAGVGRMAALDRILKGTAMPTKEDLKKEVAASKLPEAQKTFLAKSIDLSEDVEAAAELWQSLRAKAEADDPETPTPAEVTEPAPAAAAPVAPAALGADVFKSITDPTQREAIAKAAKESPALFAAFTAMEKQSATALEKAANEEAQRLDTEAVQKSKETFVHLAIDHDEVAKAMRRLAVVEPTLAATVQKAFETVEGQLDAADMFKEIGHARTVTGSTAMAKAEKLAEGFVAAGVVKTQQEGVAKAFKENPALYAEHENEGTR